MTLEGARSRSSPLKIALVSPYDFPYPGGVSSHIANLSERFRDAGHEVHILAPSSDVAAATQFPNFHRVGKTIVPLRSNASIARVTFSLTLGPQVKRLLRKHQFDIIHIHEPMVPLLPWYVLWFSRAVNVGTFHASRATATVYRTYKPLIRTFFGRLDGKIAVSNSARDFVFGCFPSDYRVIPNGINVERYALDVDPFPHLRDGKFNVLFVGRLDKRKGLTYLLDAMWWVQRLRRDVRLIIVGAISDRQLERAKRAVRRLGLEDVQFAGFVSEQDKLRFYKSADLFCAPAIGGRESQGLVLLEAMAAGTPVVASDIPGYRSVSPDGKAALFVRPQDTKALARAILRLVHYPRRAEALRVAGLTRAKAFSWDEVAERVCAYYMELLERRRQDSPAERLLPAATAGLP